MVDPGIMAPAHIFERAQRILQSLEGKRFAEKRRLLPSIETRNGPILFNTS